MKQVQITSVCDIQVGKTPSRSNPLYWGSGSLWLSIADMNQGSILSTTKETITERGIRDCNCKIIPKNTVLFSFKLSIGKVGITNIPMYTNEAIAAFIIKDHLKLDTKFLFYVLKSVDHSIGSNKAVMGKTLNKEQLKKIEIPLPPIEDQKRIVKILDEADALRQKRKLAIGLLDDYLKSEFLSMFGDPITNKKGWPIIELKDLCGEVIDCPHSTPKYSADKTNYPCIRSSDMQCGFLDFSTTKYIDEKQHYERIRRCKPNGGDIIYCREGARFGEVAYLSKDINASLGQRTMLLRAKTKTATGEFLWGLMNNKGISYQAAQLVNGAASPHINVKDIKKYKVFQPPLELQEKYSKIFLSSFSIKQKMLAQSEEIKKQFQSMMQKAFNGAL